MGFGLGKSEPADGEWERWLAGLSEPERASVLAGHAIVAITARASRLGGEAFNQRLTEERGAKVKEGLVARFGLNPANIEINAEGEDAAKERGAPDDRDNSNDRVALLKVLPNRADIIRGDDGSPEQLGTKLADRLPSAPRVDKVREQGHEVIHILVDTGDSFFKEGPEGAAKTLLKEGAKFGVKHLAEDFTEAKLHGELSTNFIPEYLNRLGELTGVAVRHEGALQVGSPFGERGRELADEAWNSLSPQGQQQLVDGMRADQKSVERAFERGARARFNLDER
jgi:hypothetical protein